KRRIGEVDVSQRLPCETDDLPVVVINMLVRHMDAHAILSRRSADKLVDPIIRSDGRFADWSVLESLSQVGARRHGHAITGDQLDHHAWQWRVVQSLDPATDNGIAF